MRGEKREAREEKERKKYRESRTYRYERVRCRWRSRRTAAWRPAAIMRIHISLKKSVILITSQQTDAMKQVQGCGMHTYVWLQWVGGMAWGRLEIHNIYKFESMMRPAAQVITLGSYQLRAHTPHLRLLNRLVTRLLGILELVTGLLGILELVTGLLGILELVTRLLGILELVLAKKCDNSHNLTALYGTRSVKITRIVRAVLH
jgi:hypothetical protein